MEERTVKGKNFVFVGGSQGVGRAAVLELARRGASVLILGRNREAGAAIVAQAREVGAASAAFSSQDIGTAAGVRAAADTIRSWEAEIHGLMHTAITPFNKKIVTDDGFELGFAVQYFARAMLNRLLIDRLAASGDGRIVHIAANVSAKMADVDLDDLQFEHRKWSLMRSVFGTHYLGFLHLQEAAKRYANLPISFTASCIESTKTPSALDPKVPMVFRVLARFGATPERACHNAVTLLTTADVSSLKSAISPTSKKFNPTPMALDPASSRKLWEITDRLALERDLSNPRGMVAR